MTVIRPAREQPPARAPDPEPTVEDCVCGATYQYLNIPDTELVTAWITHHAEHTGDDQ